jgi:hypothetical protein
MEYSFIRVNFVSFCASSSVKERRPIGQRNEFFHPIIRDSFRYLKRNMSFESGCRQAIGDQQQVKANLAPRAEFLIKAHMKVLARSEPFRPFLTVYSSYGSATLFG